MYPPSPILSAAAVRALGDVDAPNGRYHGEGGAAPTEAAAVALPETPAPASRSPFHPAPAPVPAPANPPPPYPPSPILSAAAVRALGDVDAIDGRYYGEGGCEASAAASVALPVTPARPTVAGLAYAGAAAAAVAAGGAPPSPSQHQSPSQYQSQHQSPSQYQSQPVAVSVSASPAPAPAPAPAENVPDPAAENAAVDAAASAWWIRASAAAAPFSAPGAAPQPQPQPPPSPTLIRVLPPALSVPPDPAQTRRDAGLRALFSPVGLTKSVSDWSLLGLKKAGSLETVETSPSSSDGGEGGGFEDELPEEDDDEDDDGRGGRGCCCRRGRGRGSCCRTLGRALLLLLGAALVLGGLGCFTVYRKARGRAASRGPPVDWGPGWYVPPSAPGEAVPPPAPVPATSAPTTAADANRTRTPTASPTLVPTAAPTLVPTIPLPKDLTYHPGDLTVSMEGLLLSTGLSARVVARSGQRVRYGNGQTSRNRFHGAPDFGGTFPRSDGGWTYVSNSEVDSGRGGVGALTFDRNGTLTGYRTVLSRTSMNCGGGVTPWNTWISCEEVNEKGHVWEVHPEGEYARKTSLGGTGGRFESFSYDVRDRDVPRFFVTEDKFNGPLRRYTPQPRDIDWDNPESMLHGRGKTEYLVLEPDPEAFPDVKAARATYGNFTWSSVLRDGRQSALELYPNLEGIDVANNELFVVSKRLSEMTILNLDDMTYRTVSTKRGLFDGGPDQIQRITRNEGLLYFTEEGGEDAGVHARDGQGRFYTVLESPVWKDETTGLAFSPDLMHMYVAWQRNGILFDVTRDDGYPFGGRSINAKFHAMDGDSLE